MIKVALVGSRDYNNYENFKQYVNKTLEEWKLNVRQIVVVSGGARYIILRFGYNFMSV